MRLFSLLCILLITSCSIPKKNNDSEKTTTKSPMKEEVNTPSVKNIENELIVVLKNPKNVKDAKALITNSGLSWDKLLFDQKDLKIAQITVPKDKADFWLKRLQESGVFQSVEKNQLGTFNTIKEDFENRLISIRKTPCFGDCPVYEVTISKDGKVTYNGINFVNEKGVKEFQLSEKELKKLNEKLSKKDFSEFAEEYNNPRITDLPSTYITHGGKQIHIRLWKDIPDELADVHEYIEGILLDKKYFD